MQGLLKPIRTESLKEVFINRFEELILSGKISVGQRLPSERELAVQLGVSRPVVHEGLLDLAAKGLVTMIPRVGTIVNDFRKEGSLSLLTSLVNYHQGGLEPHLLESLLDMRQLFEVESARLAAHHRTREHLSRFNRLLDAENQVDHDDLDGVCELDFKFHHLVAMASGNLIYPLLMTSFKQCYLNLAGQFYSDPSVILNVFKFHRKMVNAIDAKDAKAATKIMTTMLAQGAQQLQARSLEQSG